MSGPIMTVNVNLCTMDAPIYWPPSQYSGGWWSQKRLMRRALVPSFRLLGLVSKVISFATLFVSGVLGHLSLYQLEMVNVVWKFF